MVLESMKEQSFFYAYTGNGPDFHARDPHGSRGIYFPLCGPSAREIKSAVTPFLSGDSKVDKNHFLLKPVSCEDLRWPARNFFVSIEGKCVCSFADSGPWEVEAGPLWFRSLRHYEAVGLGLGALGFVPVSGENLEVWRFTCHNEAAEEIAIVPTGVFPVFGRALANKHDHEHVTVLLHRTRQDPWGVMVTPTMLFNEEGHSEAGTTYYVLGCDDQGRPPEGTFPTTDIFYGEGGNAVWPEAVMANRVPREWGPRDLDGKEAVGALRFAPVRLRPGEQKSYTMVLGMASTEEEARRTFQRFSDEKAFTTALKDNRRYWREKTSRVTVETSDKTFNAWMRWVGLQPVLRRIYGCSFLPDHDYGKGGKGWRDIWQDLLSLILIEPEEVRSVLIHNFAGVRVDGSNATIIGSAPGEFIADRNAISRVWMDHGLWPFLTLLFYIEQTGDFAILLETAPYFRDAQWSRALERDEAWTPAYGSRLKDRRGKVYEGSLIEHLLIQNLVPFFNVGEHNIARLESADWNDGLDMAFERGQSVTFMSAYAGNFFALADVLERLEKACGVSGIVLAKEALLLLDSVSGRPVDYDNVQAKKDLLFNRYFPSVQPELSGETVKVSVDRVAGDLRKKGEWVFAHIRRQERVEVTEDGRRYTWFNGYYDNDGAPVEGRKDGRVRMTLTGQVFPIMSGAVCSEDIPKVVEAVDRYLKDDRFGGIRLNTDFGVPHYLRLGRAFGFAYGTKENGSVFSHMAVMYAYALYHRGFARQGRRVLKALYTMSVSAEHSRIFPGIPEYFEPDGRGRYHYLTGSASWFVLTVVTKVFGLRGLGGDLVLDPALTREEFDEQGMAGLSVPFAGRSLRVTYENPQALEVGQYRVAEVSINGRKISVEGHQQGVRVPKTVLTAFEGLLSIRALLAEK